MRIEKKMSLAIGLTLFAIIVWTPPIVHAWSAEDVLSHFQPYIAVQEEYNSNIDLTPNRIKESDYITTIYPGFRFFTAPRSPVTGESRKTLTTEEKYAVDLDFSAGFNFYAKNHDNNYTSLNGLLNARYALTQRLNFRVRDYLIRSDNLQEPEYSATAIPGQYLISRTGSRVPWFRNVLEPSMEYRFGRENVVALNFRNNIYEIQSRISVDSMENYINPRINYWFNIRHGVSFEYGLTLGDFQESADLVGHMAMGRYTYRFNPRTSIFGEYAHLWRNFASPPVEVLAPSVDYVVYQPSIGIEHAFSPTLSAKAQAGYYSKNPEKGSTIDGPFFDVLLTQRAQRTTYTLSLQGGYKEDYFTAENLGFTQYYRGLGRITYQLLRRMGVGLFGSYEWVKYPEIVMEDIKPIDQIWTVGGNASYQMLRWLSVSVDVSHRENRSNFPDRDYSEYRGVFRVTATY
jgi:hypothetical protein